MSHRPTVVLALLLLANLPIVGGGCTSQTPGWYTSDDEKNFLPAYLDHRYRVQSAGNRPILPGKLSVACAPFADCTATDAILRRLGQDDALFPRVGKMPYFAWTTADVDPGWQGPPTLPDLCTGYYRMLCQRAVAEGYDLVVISFDQRVNTGSVSGGMRTAAASCTGGIFDARTGYVIAPIRVSYGTDKRQLDDLANAPPSGAPPTENIDDQFADRVHQVFLGLLYPQRAMPAHALMVPGGSGAVGRRVHADAIVVLQVTRHVGSAG